MSLTDNFGMGYPGGLQGLLSPQGSTIPAASTYAPQTALDAWRTMNGGGYLGGVINAPTQFVPQAPIAPVAQAPAGAPAGGFDGSGMGGTPGYQTQQGYMNAVNNVPAALASRFATFFQNGPGFSGGAGAPGVPGSAPAPSAGTLGSPSGITQGFSPYSDPTANPLASFAPTPAPAPNYGNATMPSIPQQGMGTTYGNPWGAQQGRRPSGWGGWGG